MTQAIAATDGPQSQVDLDALAALAGIAAEHVVPYGRDVAKIDLRALIPCGEGADAQDGPGKARYIVVTAITPTPFGEGKTTTAIGLAQGLTRLGEQTVLTLRQSAMGPTFGIKGGAGGSGGARILPAERMNLHLTGDFHAITAAHNLLSAMIDNHLYHGNELDIDERTITWPRVLDVNDRALRHIVTGLGSKIDGVTRQASFDITPASELMVIMSLATDLADLRKRLGRIVIGRSRSGEWISAEGLGPQGPCAPSCATRLNSTSCAPARARPSWSTLAPSAASPPAAPRSSQTVSPWRAREAAGTSSLRPASGRTWAWSASWTSSVPSPACTRV